MKYIFVCCPVRATAEKTVEQHLNEAENYEIYVRSRGHRPITPHLWLRDQMDDAIERDREIGMAMDKEALRLCDELWHFGGRISTGMQGEIDLANELGLPVKEIAEMGNMVPMDQREWSGTKA